MRGIFPNQRGQAIIFVVFAMVGLIAIVALAVDGGRAFLERQTAQNAADAVALGSALERLRSESGAWVETAYAIATTQGYDNNGNSNTVFIHSPPATGKYKGDIEYIQVVIKSRVPTTFGQVIGIRSLSVSAEAVARTKDTERLPILNGNALVSLAPVSDCEEQRAFWVHGESTLDVQGGGIFINSNNAECALTQNGNGSIRMEEGWEIRVVGGSDIQKEKLVSPLPIPAPPTSYPPPFMMPEVNCPQDAQILEGGNSMSPGAWNNGDFPPPGIDTLEAGAYCVEGGDFIMNGEKTLKGTHVVIKVESGNVRLDNSSTLDLKAPEGGELAGLLLYLPPENNTARVILNLGLESSFRGTVLAPAAEVRMNNDESSDGFHSQIIAYTFRSDGQSEIKIRYQDEENFDAVAMPQVQLIK